MAVAVVMKHNLEEQLEQAKECLKDLDANIKKLTGRDPSELRPGMRRGPIGGGGGGAGEGRGRDRNILMGNRRDSGGLMEGPPAKRRALGGAFNRLGPRTGPRGNRGEDSGDDDDLPHKPTVQSSIVATPKEMKSRKDCLEEQKSDSRGLARNRRMFGLLLGTLQKFKDEETVKKETKRFEIEKKLEAAAEKEKEELKRERQELFAERRERQKNLRRLEHKMEVVKQHDEWETHQKNLLNFIQTKTKPSIFYLPAKHTLVTEERLKESKKRIEALISERRSNMEEEIQAVDQNRMSISEQQPETIEEMEAEVEMEEEPILKDEEENAVIIGETEPKEDEDQPINNQPVPESGNDLATDDLKEAPKEDEPKIKTEDIKPNEMEKANGGDMEMADLPKDDEPKTILNETINQAINNENPNNDPEIFTKDQSLLTEKEFEPIYD